MTVTVSNADSNESSVIEYSKYYGIYNLLSNAYDENLNSVPKEDRLMVSGFIPGFDAALALIGAGTSLCSGIKNLKSKNEENYNVTINTNNLTTCILGVRYSNYNHPEMSGGVMGPSENISSRVRVRMGSFASGYATTLNLSLMSKKDPSHYVLLTLKFSDETSENQSRQIQLNSINIDGGSEVKNPFYGNSNSQIYCPVWKVTTDFGTFLIRCTPVASSIESTMTLNIVEELEIPA